MHVLGPIYTALEMSRVCDPSLQTAPLSYGLETNNVAYFDKQLRYRR